MRVCQDGKRTLSRKVRVVEDGMGWRVRDEGRVGLRTEVECGSNGDVEAGVMRALRVVEMLSSIEARDNRRKSHRTRVLKQSCGVRGGVGVGLDIMRLGLGGEEGDGWEV
jgi:hypothetical protein